MRKIVIAASLISCIALHALEQKDAPRGIYLSPQEWQELRATADCPLDQVIYRDGERQCGELENIPSMTYQFGNIAFKIKDLSLVIFAPNDNKVQYITHDGSNFVGSLSKENSNGFKFAVETDGLVVTSPLDLSRVKYIVLKERETRLNPKNKLYTILLQNGDEIAVQLDAGPIHLSDGQKSFQITPDEIIDICFNGGIYGSTTNGRLGFSFLKDRYLEVHVAWGNQTLRLPWDNISGIRRQENISLLDNESETRHVAKGSLLIIKEPESIFVENQAFEKLSEIVFDAVALFMEGVPFEEYNIAFEADPVFEDKLQLDDYSKIAFEPQKMFETPGFFDEWDVAFETPEVLTPERISEMHYEMLAGESVPDNIPGVDLDEKAFADELVAVHHRQEEIVDVENREVLVMDDDYLDDAVVAQECGDDNLDGALSLEEGDSMVYIPHQIHTLGEYTQKTHSLVRDKTLETTVLPTDQYPTLIVRIPGFYIDRHLVTNEEYAQFVEETNRRYPDHWDGGYVPKGQEKEPVVNVTYHDAKAYAAWLGKRLPTESEWIRAANKGIFQLGESHLLKEWTSSPAYPSEGDNGDMVVVAPMHFKKQEIMLIPHSAPREVITIMNENVSNAQTGFRCMSAAQE